MNTRRSSLRLRTVRQKLIRLYVNQLLIIESLASTNIAKQNMKSFAIPLITLVFASVVFGETCQKPEVISSTYVTEDATILTNVAFTTQFTLTCSNGAKDISLYAEVEGKALPAVRLSADNKYQVIHTEFYLNAHYTDYFPPFVYKKNAGINLAVTITCFRSNPYTINASPI